MPKQRQTKLSLTAIEKDLSFSNKAVWLWVRIPPTPYEFLDDEYRERLAQSMDIGLSNILVSDDKSLECQLIVTTAPFTTEQWINDLYDRSNLFTPSEYLPEFLTKMETRVNNHHFKDRKVYLGVKLGMRSEYTSSNSMIPLNDIFSLLLPKMGVQDNVVSDKELNYWNDKARNFKRSLLTGNLKAQEVHAEEIAYLAKKPFWPNMEVPPVDLSYKETWGLGELDYLTDARIENHAKYLKITQVVDGKEQVGYRSTLAFARFPDTMLFPQNEPWIHFSASLQFSADFYSRFTIEPARKVRKEINKKAAEVKDQAVNMTSAGGSVNYDVQERYEQALALDHELSKSRTPWVFARHRIIVEGSTEDELKDRVQRVIDHYKDLNIQLIQPTGDQLSLLLESMPNDQSRLGAYYQRQGLSILSTGMPSGNSSVGDQVIKTSQGDELGFVGPYIGYTTSRVLSPVFLSPHAGIAAGNPPGVLITGSPGSGKSFCAFTLTYLMALMGTWTIYIDPKGDAIPMAKLPGIENSTRVFDLRDGNDGMLDPFSLGRTAPEQKELALEVIGLFLGGFNHLSEGQVVEISEAINFIASRPEPSLNRVVEYLLGSDTNAAKSVGNTLNLIRDLPFARLCFSPKISQGGLSAQDGMTIITLLGLDLPDAKTPAAEYTNANRLAVSIMYLLTSYTRQLMMSVSKNQPKAIVIDEAWAVTATQQGMKLVLDVARMGRSLNTGIILVSQNAGDFQGESVTNSVSTKIAFRAKATTEIDNILSAMNLEMNETNRNTIRNLENGECIIKDYSDRIARVKIDAWNQPMTRAFETNPDKRRKQEDAEKAF